MGEGWSSELLHSINFGAEECNFPIFNNLPSISPGLNPASISLDRVVYQNISRARFAQSNLAYVVLPFICLLPRLRIASVTFLFY